MRVILGSEFFVVVPTPYCASRFLSMLRGSCSDSSFEPSVSVINCKATISSRCERIIGSLCSAKPFK